MNAPALSSRRIRRIAPGWLFVSCEPTAEDSEFVEEVLHSAQTHHVRRVLVDLAEQNSPSPKMLGHLRRLQAELTGRNGMLRVIGQNASDDNELPFYPTLETALFAGAKTV